MKKKLNVVLLIFGLFLLFGSSELIYIYKNNPRLIQTYYIWRAQLIANKDLQKSISFIVAGAERYDYRGKKDINPYPQDFEHTKINFPQNTNLENDLRNYLENPNLRNLYIENFYNYPRILYDLAQIAYKDNDSQLFIALMQTATVRDISMSYWPVELANYYYSIGNQTKAFEILGDCQKISNTKLHCTQAETSFKEDKKAFEIGFLKNAVEEIYKHKSLDY